jgi:hypothetical protein
MESCPYGIITRRVFRQFKGIIPKLLAYLEIKGNMVNGGELHAAQAEVNRLHSLIDAVLGSKKQHDLSLLVYDYKVKQGKLLRLMESAANNARIPHIS